ncbi:MAG: carboxymuconolactone decarboxylase family protein [Coriobacteriales bacterium]|nr:carboxymuconolactone decarboxylase family protein [Coriobacteriales bacterium]
MKRHFAGAKEAGATEDEIREVLANAMMVGAGRLRHVVEDELPISLELPTE